MAVVTLYQSDRDPSKTFSDKKEADVYDKKLALIETVGAWMKREVPQLSDEQAERLGTLVAEHKADLIKALKGKPEVLGSPATVDEAEPVSVDDEDDGHLAAAASNNE